MSISIETEDKNLEKDKYEYVYEPNRQQSFRSHLVVNELGWAFFFYFLVQFRTGGQDRNGSPIGFSNQLIAQG